MPMMFRGKTEASPRKEPRRKKIIIIGVAAVMLTFGVALTACSSANQTKASDFNWESVIESNPSDPFVQSYKSGDTELGITIHAQLGYSCSECHDQEDAALVGVLDAAPNARESDATVGTRETCLACHDSDSIVEKTADVKGTVTVYNPTGVYNPHNNHRGDENCSDCHSMHSTSELYCVECHEIQVPAGWHGFM